RDGREQRWLRGFCGWPGQQREKILAIPLRGPDQHRCKCGRTGCGREHSSISSEIRFRQDPVQMQSRATCLHSTHEAVGCKVRALHWIQSSLLFCRVTPNYRIANGAIPWWLRQIAVIQRVKTSATAKPFP